MAYSHVAHDCIIGNYCILSNNTQMAGHVLMGDHAILAGMCAVHQFVKLASMLMWVAVHWLVKMFPPFIKAGRTPLLRRCKLSWFKTPWFSLDRINQILDIYRIIYNKGLNTSQALNFIEEELTATDERDEIVTFYSKAAGNYKTLYKKAAATMNKKPFTHDHFFTNVGKRYNREWIFRGCTYLFRSGNSYAITGSNGSGKSTLLQVISGAVTHNEGTIQVKAI